MDEVSVLSVRSTVDDDLQIASNSTIFVEDIAKLLRMRVIDLCHDLVGVFEIASATAELDFHLIGSCLVASHSCLWFVLSEYSSHLFIISL